MKRALPVSLTLILLLSLTSSLFVSYAQTTPDQSTQSVEMEWSEEGEDEPPVSRVARLSFIDGDVSFLRSGTSEWAGAVENLPLLAGDHIYVGRGGRAELQLGRGNYIRLAEETNFAITDLSDTAAQFEITDGAAIVRVERLSSLFKRFEVDTPNAALLLQEDGLYRINVKGENDSEVSVRKGFAEVSTTDGSFRVREGHRLVVDTNPGGRLEIAYDNSHDNWDQWNIDRDTSIAESSFQISPDYVNTYETTYDSFYGVSDLANYGTWTDIPSYGYCWRPRVSHDWAPYRHGQWVWIPRAGWTWLASERWGWAPYHYGRWAFVSGYGWLWVPGFVRLYENQRRNPWFYHNARYYRWRPALVYFFNCPTSRGQYLGWYPLSPGERWRRPDRYRRDRDESRLRYPGARDGARRPDQRAGIPSPRNRDGITIMPIDGITRPDRSRSLPVAPDRETARLIDREARPGLPDITPTPVAVVPRLRDGEGRLPARRALVPPDYVMKRPILTRNRVVDGSGENKVPRERRLIVPQPGDFVTGTPRSKEKTGENRENRRTRLPERNTGEISGPDKEKGDDPPRIAIPRPVNRDSNEGEERVNKRRRGDETIKLNPPAGSEGNETGEPARERRRKEPVVITQPEPKDNDSAQGDSGGSDRKRNRGDNNDRAKEPEKLRQPAEDSTRLRNRDETPARRPEPRIEQPRQQQENKTESRQERRQEKQESRQERREERKKP
jgi:hypothetical protein